MKKDRLRAVFLLTYAPPESMQKEPAQRAAINRDATISRVVITARIFPRCFMRTSPRRFDFRLYTATTR